MKTLYNAIQDHAGQQAQAITKHLNRAGITGWADMTKSRLSDFRDITLNEVAASSARTYFAVLKTVIARYEEEVDLPCRSYRDVLKAKNEKPLKTYLTIDELRLLEAVEAKGEIERMVKCQFLIGAYTGMRISDIRAVSSENVNDGVLTYVSIKTKITASIPCADKVARWIDEEAENHVDVNLMSYNRALRRLCKRAGINSRVKVFKGGETLCGEKWQFVSSHTARISFATNLSECDVKLQSISKLCGHSSVTMTQRYIVSDRIDLNDKAMAFLS